MVDPIGRKGVLLILWGDNVHVYRMFKSNFCIEMEIECDSFAGKCWVIFVYASTGDNIRKMQ